MFIKRLCLFFCGLWKVIILGSQETNIYLNPFLFFSSIIILEEL